MTIVMIYEQEVFGTKQWRAMRKDGQLLMGAHQIDFPTETEAVRSTLAHFRRAGDSDATVVIRMHRLPESQPYDTHYNSDGKQTYPPTLGRAEPFADGGCFEDYDPERSPR